MKKICSVEGCGKAVKARGWCGTHWTRWRRWGVVELRPSAPAQICTVSECNRVVKARGWCSTHYRRWQRHGTVALAERPELRVQPSGHLWRWEPGHPLAAALGYVPEHRRVAWEAGLLNFVNIHCIVHHIDEDPGNNDVPNLRVMTIAEHTRLHHLKNTGPCSAVDGCDRPAAKRGWCIMHYERWRRHGSFDVPKRGKAA